MKTPGVLRLLICMLFLALNSIQYSMQSCIRNLPRPLFFFGPYANDGPRAPASPCPRSPFPSIPVHRFVATRSLSVKPRPPLPRSEVCFRDALRLRLSVAAKPVCRAPACLSLRTPFTSTPRCLSLAANSWPFSP